jgi:hypothetical protein
MSGTTSRTIPSTESKILEEFIVDFTWIWFLVFSVLLRFKVSFEGIRWLWCAQGVHAKHGHMRAESRSVRRPVAMAHGKRQRGCSAGPLLESWGRRSLGGLALATGPWGGPGKDGLERLLGEKIKKKIRKGEWAGPRKWPNRLGGKGKCFLFSKPSINCKLFWIQINFEIWMTLITL